MQIKPEQLSKIIIEETTKALERERRIEEQLRAALAGSGKPGQPGYEKPGFLKTAYGHFMKGFEGEKDEPEAEAAPEPSPEEELAPEEAPDVGGTEELEANLSALQSMVDEHEADYEAHEKKMTNMVDLIRRAVLDLTQGRTRAARAKAPTLKSGFAEGKQKEEIKKLLKLFEN